MRTYIPRNAVLIPDTAKRVFKGIIYDTYHWEQKMYDGSTQTFEMLRRPDTVKIIAIKDDKVVVTKQQQPNLKEFFDIPGGMHDEPQEDEFEAAKRELKEEVGLVCKNWKLVSVTQAHNKIEQFIYIFLAWDVLEEREQTLDSGEKISIELFDFSDFKSRLGTEGFRSPKMAWIQNIDSISELLSIPEYKT